MTDDLPEIVIAELGQNTRDVVRVSLAAFKGTPTVGVWRFYRDAGGNLRPGKGGIVMGLRHLPLLAEALRQALEVARESGRLRDD
jgi:Transcriptional Coactivator p15 (PC4)